MKPETHEFDPEGDVILLLDIERLKFSWRDDTLTLGIDSKPPKGKSKKKKKKGSSSDGIGFIEWGAVVHDTDSEAPHVADVPLSKSQQIRMRVSSRHLMLASPVFQRMLSGPWIESQKDRSGIREIETSGWDHTAMIILLDIIHNHHRVVPRQLDLETLAKLAIIVDYYECHEPVEVFAEIWVEKLKDELPYFYGKESMLWLLISCVFPRPDILEKMARQVMNSSSNPVQALDVPIPMNVLDEINEMRSASLFKIFSLLYDMIEKLSGKKAECTYECAAILLGTLMKELKRYGALSPRVTAPFRGYSVTYASIMVQAFKTPTWGVQSKHSIFQRHQCTIQQRLAPILDQVRQEAQEWKISASDVGANKE